MQFALDAIVHAQCAGIHRDPADQHPTEDGLSCHDFALVARIEAPPAVAEGKKSALSAPDRHGTPAHGASEYIEHQVFDITDVLAVAGLVFFELGLPVVGRRKRHLPHPAPLPELTTPAGDVARRTPHAILSKIPGSASDQRYPKGAGNARGVGGLSRSRRGAQTGGAQERFAPAVAHAPQDDFPALFESVSDRQDHRLRSHRKRRRSSAIALTNRFWLVTRRFPSANISTVSWR